MLSYRRPSAKIALSERSEFAILEGRDLESINFWNEIFGQELFFFCKLKTKNTKQKSLAVARLFPSDYSYLLLDLLLEDLIYPTILIKTRTMAIHPTRVIP